MNKDINVDLLSVALREMQSNIIGLFYFHKDPTMKLYLVYHKEDTYLKMVQVGSLLGLSEMHADESAGRFTFFPNNKTLAELMKDPFELQNFYNTFHHTIK